MAVPNPVKQMSKTIAIDGTHIRIKSPSEDEHLYVNRKNYHSVNVQVLCDVSLKFLNVLAKWPGGNHDAFIWQNYNLRDMFENRIIANGWLLGDWISTASMAAYPCNQPND